MTEKAGQWSTFTHSEETFALNVDAKISLAQAVDACHFDTVHFFIREALDAGAIVEPSSHHHSATRYGLLRLRDGKAGLTDAVLEELQKSQFRPATLRELLAFAKAFPEHQRKRDVIALGTLRTRKVYPDRAGETVWNELEPDKRICQWAVGLSGDQKKRTLNSVELYLKDYLRPEADLLVVMG